MQYVNFGLFLLSNALSFGAMWGQRAVAGWLVWQMTASPTWLAATVAVELASAVVIAPVVGLWLDSCDRLRVLVFSQVIATCLTAALAFLAYAEHLTPYVLFVFMATLGCAGAVYLPARLALLLDIAGVPEPTRANSLMALASQIGATAIPAAVGVVVAMFGATWAFGVLSCLNVIATLTMFAVVARSQARDLHSGPTDQLDWATARKFLRESNKGLSKFLLVFLITIVASRGLMDMFAGYVDVILKGDIVVLSRLTAAIAAGALLASIALLVIGRSDTYRQLWLSLLLALIGTMGLAMTRDLVTATVAATVLGAGMSLNTTTTQTHLLTIAPLALRGRFSTVFATIWRGGPIFGVLLMAAVVQWSSMACIGFVASGLLLLAMLASIRRRSDRLVISGPG